MSNLVFVLALAFIVVVLPLSIITSHKRKMAKLEQRIAAKEGQSATSAPKPRYNSDGETVEEMLETIDKLAERIEILEDILDENHPRWRERQKNRQQS